MKSEIINNPQINTRFELLELIESESMPNGNLSIAGTARLADCEDTDIVRGSAFGSKKLAQMLAVHGFKSSAFFSENGIPPTAVIIILEYFAYRETKPKEKARQLIRTFSTVGLLKTLEEVSKTKTQSSTTSNSDTLLAQMIQQNQTFLAGLTSQLLNTKADVESAKQVAVETKAEVKAVKEEVKADISNVQEVVQEQAEEVKKNSERRKAEECDEGYQLASIYFEGFKKVTFKKGVSTSLGRYLSNEHNGFTQNERRVDAKNQPGKHCQWLLSELPQAFCELILMRRIMGYYNPHSPNLQIGMANNVVVMPSMLEGKFEGLEPLVLIAKLFPEYPNLEALESLIPEERLHFKKEYGDKEYKRLGRKFERAKAALKKKSPTAA